MQKWIRNMKISENNGTMTIVMCNGNIVTKEILPSLVEAKQRALEDHVSRVNQALRIKRWKYEERIGGV